ncbi:DUF917 domain-containing protein [Rhodobacteraceae bacterium RKSG542]|uniref:DUF917 domain-containing protein n=1 Tax=Pseudovibrio flavus TaxID=2529854 RepID=UPI0012BB4F42|nr:DUF917 domain-containing protein [Pseudovibrio flavus]MTI17982.1 DUF917 domain-containing protein [Pseudovibrio flavus]
MAFKLNSKTDIEDFVRGCTFFATGGGGLPKNGIASLMSELEAGRNPGWVDLDDIDDEAIVACPFLMGSIAPHTPETLREMNGFGFVTSENTEKDRMRKALEELEEYTGQKIEAIVPIELAGANTSAAMAAASEMGIAVFDGDYTGRAIPEIQQTTPYLADKTLLPITSVDEWGNVAIIKNGINYRVTERLGKLISANGYGLAGQAGFLMKASEVKKIIVKNTMTQSYELGRFIREAREQGKDVVPAMMEYLNGHILATGVVTEKNDEDKLGYYWGEYKVEGRGDFANNEYRVWFKNENHVTWKNDEPYVTSPDIIALVDLHTGEPIPNPLVAAGQEVALVAMKSPEHFLSEKGLEILGPRYFDFDIDYKPLEEVL